MTTTEYANFVTPSAIISDAASEALLQGSVWRNLIRKESLPLGLSTNKTVKKEGKLSRTALPENTLYSFGAGSEYTETFVTLSAIKSTVISRLTVEAKDFAGQSPATKIGTAQGDAIRIGMEEDIAALASMFPSSITSATPTLSDVLACAFAVKVATNLKGKRATAVLSPKALLEVGTLTPATSSASIYAGMNGSTNLFLNSAKTAPDGFMGTVGGVDFFESNIIDDDGTNYRNLIFDRDLAIVGMYSDQVTVLKDLEITYFRDLIASYAYSDFSILHAEAGCRLLTPIL